jgi:hypothetical protein
VPISLRLAIYLSVLALVASAFAFTYHSGERAGRNEVQVQWDADKATQQAAADAAIAKATKEKLDAIAANEAIDEKYQDVLRDANARADDYARRLQSYEARLRAASSAPAKAPSDPGAPATAPPRGEGQLESAVGSRLAECDANEAQLESLIEELQPQL